MYCNAFFISVGQNKSVTSDYIFWWNFLFGSYFQDVESLIPKYSEYPQIYPRWGAMSIHNSRKEDNSANNCNCRFQTEMVTEAKL